MPRWADNDQRRAALARATARVIAREGLSGATIREVAAEAGWTTGAVTHYFPDKRGLLRFTLETSLADRRLRLAERARLAPADALRAALAEALPVDQDARLHWIVTVAFCSQAAGDGELAAVQRDAYRAFRADVADLVARSGRATAGSPAQREAERLISVLDGVALQALFDPQSWPPERQHAAIDEALAGSARPTDSPVGSTP